MSKRNVDLFRLGKNINVKLIANFQIELLKNLSALHSNMEIDVVFSNKSQFGIKNDYNSCYLATQYGESVIKGICMWFVANGNNLSVMKWDIGIIKGLFNLSLSFTFSKAW